MAGNAPASNLFDTEQKKGGSRERQGFRKKLIPWVFFQVCQFILIGNGMLECSSHFRISYPRGANCDRIGQRNPAQVLPPLHSTSSQSSPPFS